MDVARLVVVVLVAIIPTTARGQDPTEPLPAELEAPFQLFVNHVAKGDVIVVLRDGDVLIDRADLAAAGIQAPPGREVVAAGRTLLSLESVAPPLRYELDEREISLRIFAPPELLPHTLLDLRGAPRDLEYPTDPSAFFNYSVTGRHDGHASLYQETGLSVGGNLLLSSMSLSSDTAPVRGLSSYVVNDRSTLTRYTFGDAFVSTGTLGAGAFVGGVTVARTYELDPYAIKLPGLGLTGSTLAPATLDVYVNGNRVHSEPIEPGTFELDNLFAAGGSGTATYVVRDVFGHEHHVSTPFYSSSSLLARGVQEYTYSLGVLRHDLSKESWSYSRPAAAGTHRIGLRDGLTGGARAEVGEARVSGGPTLTLSTLAGQIDLDLAASYDPEGAGLASQVAYSYSSALISGSLFTRLHSNRYSTLSLAPRDARATVETGLSVGLPLGQRASVSYRASVALDRDAGLAGDVGLRGTFEILSSLAWTVSAGRRESTTGEVDWSITTSIGHAYFENHRADLSAEVEDSGPAARLDLSKSLTRTEDYGYRASGLLDEQPSAHLNAQYQTKVGRYTTRYASATRELALDVAGGLVVVPGIGIFPTLPVQSSFGVIRVKDVQGVRGYGNGQPVGTTDLHGNLVVPNLLAYYGNRLSIEPADVPVDRELPYTERTLAPPTRGVAIVDFRARFARFYRGTLVIEHGGRRVTPTYGQVGVAQEGGDLLSPLGEVGEFDLDGLLPGRRSLRIEYFDGVCEVDVEVPEPTGPVTELGEITCMRHDAVEPEP